MNLMKNAGSTIETITPLDAGMTDGAETPAGRVAAPIATVLPESGSSMRELTASEPGTPPAVNLPQGQMMPASVLRIPVAIQVVIGSARVPLSQVTQLGPGATITLDQKLGAPAVILVNGREVAKGELFVLDADGGRLGITITEVAGSGGNATA